MRYSILVVSFLAAACATGGVDRNRVSVETVSKNQMITGARCTANNNNGSWELVTPGYIDVKGTNGDLRVVCNKEGYRSSEFVFRPAPSSSTSLGLGIGGGGGRVGGGVGLSIPIGGTPGNVYPQRISVEMTALP